MPVTLGMATGMGRPSCDCKIIESSGDGSRVALTYFFTLSAGIAIIQKAKELSPPAKKFATPVLTCWMKSVGHGILLKKIKSAEARYLIRCSMQRGESTHDCL